MSTRKSLTAAADSIESAMDRHRKLGEHLQDLGGSLAASGDETRAQHARCLTRHDALGRSLEAAQLAVRGAQDAAQSDAGYVEPTHDAAGQGGSQVTQSQSGPPRNFSAEAIRERDQRAGIELGYRAKIATMRRR